MLLDVLLDVLFALAAVAALDALERLGGDAGGAHLGVVAQRVVRPEHLLAALDTTTPANYKYTLGLSA